MRFERSILDAPADSRPLSRQVSPDHEARLADDGNRRAFILLLGLVAVVASVCLTWGITRWPWDVDEVWSLRELGLLDAGNPSLVEPNSQAARLPRLVPLWYACQGVVLRYLPATEGNARLLPVLCAILAVLAAYIWAARRYNPAFAVCLAVLMIGSPLLLSEAQQNRFYTMAILFLVLANTALFSAAEKSRIAPVLLAGIFAVLAVLSHSLLVVYFVLAAAAALAGARLSGGSVPLRRFLVAAIACVLLYFFYVRPLAKGWNTGAHPSILSVLPSMVSGATIPVLALAFIGAIAAFACNRDASLRVWAILAGLTGLALAALPSVILMNSQYMLLFSLPFWVLAAHAVSEIGAQLGRGSLACAWYLAIALLLLPHMASHYQDGSRKDLRAAGDLISHYAVAGETIYCNLPEVLHYYLPTKPVKDWETTKDELSSGVSYVVMASNGWESPLQINGKTVETLARIGKRRFDEQTYIVSVYRVSSP